MQNNPAELPITIPLKVRRNTENIEADQESQNFQRREFKRTCQSKKHFTEQILVSHETK